MIDPTSLSNSLSMKCHQICRSDFLMDKSSKYKINKSFDNWKFTQDGRFPKCSQKYKKLRRRNQRSIENEETNKILNEI